MGAAPAAKPRAEVTPWRAQSDTPRPVLPLGGPTVMALAWSCLWGDPRVMPPDLALPLEGPVSAEGLLQFLDDEEPGVLSLIPKPDVPCAAAAVPPCSPQDLGRAWDSACPKRSLWDPAPPKHFGAAAGPDLGMTLWHPEHSPHHWGFGNGAGSFLLPKLPLSAPGTADVPRDTAQEWVGLRSLWKVPALLWEQLLVVIKSHLPHCARGGTNPGVGSSITQFACLSPPCLPQGRPRHPLASSPRAGPGTPPAPEGSLTLKAPEPDGKCFELKGLCAKS